MIVRIKLSFIVKAYLINLVFIFGLSSLSGFSQSLKKINFEEIPQRKVRKYIRSRGIDHMQSFSAIHASWKNDVDESDFKAIEEVFYLKNKLSDVWESYRHANPVKIWNRQSVRLGLLILKWSNSIIYANDSSSSEVDTGQVCFLNLRLMKGIFNVPVAFEITDIDCNKQILEFSYIDNNKSQGKQSIKFFDNGDGRTRIVHRSYFKSDSWLREDLFYPWFHRKFIKEFHENMGQHIKKWE
jgi:hypothetical protein